VSQAGSVPCATLEDASPEEHGAGQGNLVGEMLEGDWIDYHNDYNNIIRKT